MNNCIKINCVILLVAMVFLSVSCSGNATATDPATNVNLNELIGRVEQLETKISNELEPQVVELQSQNADLSNEIVILKEDIVFLRARSNMYLEEDLLNNSWLTTESVDTAGGSLGGGVVIVDGFGNFTQDLSGTFATVINCSSGFINGEPNSIEGQWLISFVCDGGSPSGKLPIVYNNEGVFTVYDIDKATFLTFRRLPK